MDNKLKALMAEYKSLYDHQTVFLVRCSDSTYYVGYSGQLVGCLVSMMRGYGADYTKTRLPIEYVGHIICKDKDQALRLKLLIAQMHKEGFLPFDLFKKHDDFLYLYDKALSEKI